MLLNDLSSISEPAASCTPGRDHHNQSDRGLANHVALIYLPLRITLHSAELLNISCLTPHISKLNLTAAKQGQLMVPTRQVMDEES